MNEAISKRNAVRLELQVFEDGSYYVTGGDRTPGEGDQPFIGIMRLNTRQDLLLKRLQIREDNLRSEACNIVGALMLLLGQADHIRNTEWLEARRLDLNPWGNDLGIDAREEARKAIDNWNKLMDSEVFDDNR